MKPPDGTPSENSTQLQRSESQTTEMELRHRSLIQDLMPMDSLQYITPEVRTVVRRSLGRTGLGAYIMRCQGSRCIYIGTSEYFCQCPLFEHKAAPMGKLCPVELIRAEELTDSLARELQINVDKQIHLEMLTRLVGLHIQRQRVIVEMSLSPASLVENRVEMESGSSTTITENPRFTTLERLDRQIEKLQKELIASPREEAVSKLKAIQTATEILEKVNERLSTTVKSLSSPVPMEDNSRMSLVESIKAGASSKEIENLAKKDIDIDMSIGKAVQNLNNDSYDETVDDILDEEM